jgi:sigma-B regulation protein RsbU (phosphoserine phosphatase)
VATIPTEAHAQLIERRDRVEGLMSRAGRVPQLEDILRQIDQALARFGTGTYGRCETCGDPIEPDRLDADPLVRFCLDHLSSEELKAHQQDLDLAMRIQSKLLPPKDIAVDGWDIHYRYEPVGPVGGDYCELILLENGKSLFFAVGDVAGKGVAASLLMTHLSAIFRSLLSLNLPLEDLMSRANHLFCESTDAAQYATLVCGRANASGVELCDAGHCSPLLLRRHTTHKLDSTGLPLGLFCSVHYTVRQFSLEAGDTLVLCSDGITEAQNPAGNEYGDDRLIASARDQFAQGAEAIAESVLRDVGRFRDSRPATDDVTLLVLRRGI